MKRSAPLYDALSLPLVVARAPALAVERAVEIFESPDPIAAARALYQSDALVRDAVALASPALARAVDDWISGKPLRNPKTPLRLLIYLVRMASRPTPFGLCAGIGNVALGTTTTLALADQDAHRTQTRPDMELAMGMAQALENSEFRSDIRYTVNTCILERGDRLYVTNVALENDVVRNGEKVTEQRAVSLKRTEAVQYVRELATVAMPYGAICAALCDRFAAPAPEAERLLDSVIEAGVLISELRASPVGDPVVYLAQRFAELSAPFAQAFGEALESARKLDVTPLRRREGADYATLQQRFATFSEQETPNALQVDLRLEFNGTLAESVLADAQLLAEYCVRMGPLPSLTRFRERFLDRYEGDERMVPLLELVDENVGLGLPESPQPEEADRNARDALLVRLVCEAQRTGIEELEMTDELLAAIVPELAPDAAVIPALEIGFQLAAASAGDVSEGNYLLTPSAFACSDAGVKSIGRFTGLLGERTRVRAAEIVARSHEDSSDIHVEFSFAPALTRMYNVAIRPLFYPTELRVGVGAPAAGDCIHVDDLWVGLHDDRFYLWSKSRGRRVAIHETHTYATSSNAPNLCRLLALIRHDGTRVPCDFDWGPAVQFTYLPRVRVGRIVLSPRRWLFDPSELADLSRLRALWNIPRYVMLTEMDRRLLLDLDSPVAADILRDQAGSEVTLIEALPAPGQTWVSGDGGTHVVEFIAQAVATRKPAQNTASPLIVGKRETHGPGSEWIYAHLYVGAQAADRLLVSTIAPFVDQVREQGLADRWFFIRYGGAGQLHLRLRLQARSGRAGQLREHFLEAAEGWLLDGLTLRYSLHTYEPEYERYGTGAELRRMEQFFCIDSDLCVEVLTGDIADTTARIAAAAASLYGCLRGSEPLSDIALQALAGLARQKLDPADRDALKAIEVEALFPDGNMDDLLAAVHPAKGFADFAHLHCNRIGLDRDGEMRALALLRALILRDRAQNKKREPVITGPR